MLGRVPCRRLCVGMSSPRIGSQEHMPTAEPRAWHPNPSFIDRQPTSRGMEPSRLTYPRPDRPTVRAADRCSTLARTLKSHGQYWSDYSDLVGAMPIALDGHVRKTWPRRAEAMAREPTNLRGTDCYSPHAAGLSFCSQGAG